MPAAAMRYHEKGNSFMSAEPIDHPPSHSVVVIEGSPLGTPTTKGFTTVEAAEDFIIERVRANVSTSLRERMEKALADRIVSEDGVKAVAEVLTSKLEFLRAFAKAYASKITISERRVQKDEDER